MSDTSDTQRLTLESPVDPSVLEHLEHLHNAWMGLIDRNTALDLEKIQVLASLKRITDERNKVFETIQVERGISPASRIEVDSKTRLVKVLVSEDMPE